MHFLKQSVRHTNMYKKSFLYPFLLALTIFFSTTGVSFATTLSIDPTGGEFGPGDTFVLTVRMEPANDECVNAVAVELLYPSDWMKAVAVSKGESVLTLWPEEPSVDVEKGIVRFNGGIPAGYCGRVQGDPGKTNILGKVIFNIPGNMIGGKVATGALPIAVVFGSSTQVLLNDGFGTPASLQLEGGSYIRNLNSKGQANEWLDIVHGDTIPPDLFTVSVERDPQTFQGKYFIVFSTIDKQSGVHHYEVVEDNPNRFGFVRGTDDKALFAKATSPYVLKDQERGSRIIVRAFDHAGNMQEAMVAPLVVSGLPEADSVNNWWWFLGLGTLLVLGLASWLLVKRNGDKSSDEPSLPA
jgi:hypothetical protein